MRKTALMIVLLLISGGWLSAAFHREGQCQVFYRDGGQREADLEFLSTRSSQISFYKSAKEPLNRIWMLNFVESRWDYAKDQTQLHPQGGDTVVYRDGRVEHLYIFSWSTARRLFYLKDQAHQQERNSRELPIGNIARVYFGNQIPSTYRVAVQPQPQDVSTGFRPVEVGVLIQGASHQVIWNGFDAQKGAYLLGDRWQRASSIQRIYLGRHNEDLDDTNVSETMTTILLEDGRILQDKLIDAQNGLLSFESLKPVDLSRVLVIAPPSGQERERRRLVPRNKR
jgi:hypothetical protein